MEKKDVQIMVSLKYLSTFGRTLQMLLINSQINIFLTWSAECILVTGTVVNQEPKFAITDTKLDVPVVTFSAQVNTDLWQ